MYYNCIMDYIFVSVIKCCNNRCITAACIMYLHEKLLGR